ncbi:pyridoxamine 5'-phosphate oxidase-like protein [Modicisalibacter xianhensis]|uniref:Pyridoxamine 5'-phosphate oxidase-like protein n=1 Tax=Modicisalibacter xianhensis TaxID=442341 RepID=A0A4R8FX15_9GAMM|nr:pyridoxamine 5'-phosphate oxidase-like protein [Halomonas xianhensis]
MASDDRKASLPLTLDDIDASAWGELANATDDPQSGFRYLTLCSVDAESKPQARMVVLRDVDKSTRTLTFHTDIAVPSGWSYSETLT